MERNKWNSGGQGTPILMRYTVPRVSLGGKYFYEACADIP